VTNKIQNPNCDGQWCRKDIGPVRLYPLGGSGNLILCRDCFNHENAYRRLRGRQTRSPENWPEVEWDTAKHYGPEEPA
jgi:hypothetical protein